MWPTHSVVHRVHSQSAGGRFSPNRAKAKRTCRRAGFDFAFQPSLDRNRILVLAGLQFIDRAEALHFVGPPEPES
jgi:hypothetical protein